MVKRVHVLKENINKSRWYDGLLYSMAMDPVVGKSFSKTISQYVSAGSSVIDIGCGVGSVARELSNKCSHVTGIDLSIKMVNYARKRLAAASIYNVEILLGSAADLSSQVYRTYDYAVMTQFLHEIRDDDRNRVMEKIKEIAREFIIADFIAPCPDSISGRMISFLEMLAGKEHNDNFRDWLGRGGLDGFLDRHGLTVIDERNFSTGVGKIVKAKAM